MTIVGTTPDGRKIVAGAELFALKDTQGFPLAMSFSECAALDLEIDWAGLIEAARAQSWWDFQILAAIAEGFADSGVWADRREAVERRCKFYMATRQHPALAA